MFSDFKKDSKEPLLATTVIAVEEALDQSLREAKRRSLMRTYSGLLAITAAFFFGIQNYLIAVATVHRPSLSCIYPQFVGYITCYPVFHLVKAIKNKVNSSEEPQKSPYYDATGHFIPLVLVFLAIRASGSVLGFFNTYFIAIAAIRAGVSVGVILSIASLSAFFTALVFYLVYKERLRLKHVFGMFVMLLCLGSIAMSKSGPPSARGEPLSTESLLPVYVPIMLTLA